MWVRGVLFAAVVAVISGCGGTTSSGTDGSCVNTASGEPQRCGEAGAIPKSQYSGEVASTPTTTTPVARPKVVVHLRSAPSGGSSATAVLVGRVTPSHASVRILQARFDSESNGRGFTVFKRLRISNGRFRVVVPANLEQVEYKATAKALTGNYRAGGSRILVVGPPAPAEPEPAEGDSFTGNGTKNLGNITVSEASVMRWSSSGSVFSAVDDSGQLAVSSTGRSGTSALPPGTYKNVQVIADGDWTIKIRPR